VKIAPRARVDERRRKGAVLAVENERVTVDPRSRGIYMKILPSGVSVPRAGVSG